MKMNPLICTFSALLGTAPLALADISLGSPAVSPQQSAAYHADLLSSNAVRAAFKEIRSIPVVKLDAEPSSEEVAVFEVKQNLAHRRYDRMGDGALKAGKLFSISLATDIPGQDAELGSRIRELQAGDEALLNIDHIYVFREEGNENVHACTRFVKIQPRQASEDAPAAAPAQERLPLPMTSSSRQVFTQITVEPDGQGGMRRMKIVEQRERSADGQEHVRKFINDVEVDPQTNQPLPLSASQPQQQPAQDTAATPAPTAEDADTPATPAAEPADDTPPATEPQAPAAAAGNEEPPIPEPNPLPTPAS